MSVAELSSRARILISGARGPRGFASGPLGAGSVDAETITDDSDELLAILDKLVFSHSGITATAGSVLAKLRSTVSVTDEPFGAVGDAVQGMDGTWTGTDNTDAIKAAIAYAKARGGLTIYFPTGNYLHGNLGTVDFAGLTFEGSSFFNTRLISTVTTGLTLTFSGALNIEVVRLGITYSEPLEVGDAPVWCVWRGASSTGVFNVRVEKIGTLIQFGDPTSFGYDATTTVRGNSANIGMPLYEGYAWAGLTFTNHRWNVFGVPPPDPDEEMTTVADSSFFRARASVFAAGDTFNVGGVNIIERAWRFLDIEAASGCVIQNGWVSDETVVDFCRNKSININPKSGGGILGWKIWGYHTSWDDHAIHINAQGLAYGIVADGVSSYYAGKCNFKIEGTNHRYCGIRNSQLEAGNRVDDSYAGIDASGGQGHFFAEGNKSGIDGAYGGLPFQAVSGIKLGADMNFKRIVGNTCFGSVKGYDFATNTVATASVIEGNLGTVDYAAVASFDISASETVNTNKSGAHQQYILKGTTTALILNGSVDLGASSDSVTLDLEDGDSFKVFYSGTKPTCVRRIFA